MMLWGRGGRTAGVVGSASMVAVAWSTAVFAAAAPAGYEIAKQNACLGCHTVDRKLVGPAFRDIAAKYKGDTQAAARLAKKVRNGGAGVWGVIPMPSHPRMTYADIHTVVGWVLSGAPTEAK
jgi:cytochrome c